MRRNLTLGASLCGMFVVIGAIVITVSRPVQATVPAINTITSVNNSGDGQGGNNDSGNSSFGNGALLSASGRYVVFASKATNLINGDSNAKQDIFVRDIAQNTTTRINVSASGVEANDNSDVMAISETGRYIVFRSAATNLIDGQTASSAAPSMYLYDMKDNSVSTLFGPSVYNNVTGISSDGKVILYETINGNNHIYLYNRDTQTSTQLDIPASGTQQAVDSNHAVLSCDGAFAVFDSAASNFVANDTNAKKDVFLVDMRLGGKLTDLTISADNDSVNPTISCNGNYVGFTSNASNILSGTTVSATQYDGHYYRYDRVQQSYDLIDRASDNSIAVAGAQMSYGGLALGIANNGDAIFPGSYNLTGGTGAKQIFVRNINAATTEVLTTDGAGHYSNSQPHAVTISADGKLVSMLTGNNPGFMPGDTNGYSDAVLAQTGL